ncbi:MAG: type II secretion system secretin GspD [Bdellovibrionota bacterium]
MKKTNVKFATKLIVGLGASLVVAQSSRPMPGANLGSNSGSSESGGGAPNTDAQYMDASKIGDYVELDSSIKNEMYGTIDFPNAELKDIIKAISKLARKNFILDRKIENRRITILSPEPVTKQEAYNAFLSALYMNDLTIVAEGKFLKVIDTKAALQANVRVFMGDYAPNTAEVITVLYPLKFLNAEDIQRYLTDLVPRSGRIAAYPNTNTLVMTDTGFNLRRVIQIIKTIDMPGHEDQLETIPIRYATAKDVGKLIDEILSGQSGGAASRVSRTRPQQKTRGGGTITKIVPDERTNSLVVLANGRGIKEIKDLVRQLDTSNAAGGGNIHLYYCKNAVAEDLANTINGLTSGSNATKSSAPGGNNAPLIPNPILANRNGGGGDSSVRFEGNLRVTADKPTNSLVVVGSASDFAALKKILEKLDIPRRQVYVEATIMEINLDKASQFTIAMNLAAPGLPSAGGFVPTSPSLNLAGLLTSPGALTGLMAGFASKGSVNFTDPSGTTRSIPNALGFIKALVDSTQGQILHQPQILTSDNQEASITVTSKIATETTTTTVVNGTVVQTPNIDKVPVEISLKLTPQLGEGSDLIRLKVDQVVDDYQPSAVGGQIDTTQRKASTNVVVRDGDMVVIGGLQKETISDRKSRIPILGDLPIIGKLFGGTDNKSKKSVLVLFLTPYVINDYSDLMKITERKIDQRLDIGRLAKDPEDRLRPQVQRIKAQVQENALKPAPRSWSHRGKVAPKEPGPSDDLGLEETTNNNPSMDIPNTNSKDFLPEYNPVPQQGQPATPPSNLEASPAPGTRETPPSALQGGEGA